MAKNKYITDPKDPRVASIIRSAQIMYTIASLLDIQIAHELTDTKFKNDRNLNNTIRLLKQSVSNLKIGIAQYVRVKDSEDFNYDFSVEMYRLLSHFAMLPTEQIREFMDNVEKLKNK